MITPKQDNIIVEIQKAEKETKTNSGIIIQNSQAAFEKQSRGVVVAIGTGRRTLDGTLIPVDLKVGDEVLFNKFAGTEIEIDDKLYLILRENDVLATL